MKCLFSLPSVFNQRLSSLFLAACLCLSSAFYAGAQSTQSLQLLKEQLPADIQLTIFIDDTSANTLSVGGNNELNSYEWLASQDGQFADFLRVNVNEAGQNTWDVTAKSIGNQEPIKKGDWVYASYYARASGETESINIRGFIERSVPSWMMISDASVAAGSKWTRVVASGKAPEDLAKDSVYISLHLAAKKQSLDIANIVFVSAPGNIEQNLFPVTELSYSGMEESAPWRTKAKQMIKQHREGSFQIFVLNQQGEAIPNAEVSIQMQDVDYELGSMAHGLLVEDSEIGQQYRKWFAQFFNYATATIYWADWGWENPEVRESYLKKMTYFQEQNIDMRGHVLLYPAFRFSPQVLIDLQDDKQAFIARVNQQIDEIVPLLKAFGMNEYDVINELRAEKEWLDIVGMETVVDWYKRVHALHPEAILYINENSILTDGGDNTGQKDHYYDLITELLEKGAPIHGIGMQGHFNGIVTPVDKMWKILDRFASFNLPIRITEYDTDTRDVQGQALFDTDFYEAMYAHPATVGVTRWGFYEPVMWRPAGALIDSQNDFKPNAQAYMDWLYALRDFQQTLISDKQGSLSFAGKYGRYRVTAQGEEFSCEFTQPPTHQDIKPFSQSCTLRMAK